MQSIETSIKQKYHAAPSISIKLEIEAGLKYKPGLVGQKFVSLHTTTTTTTTTTIVLLLFWNLSGTTQLSR